ncbi:DNA-directed RNA polymerase subunit omega [Lactococcus termiticola]|uniref:DNA-directed RNA polymerase subunit omega n=1 Tax=Lactococcus termiticola TaxID=2169526 RepID=A0A2R5HG47_9LACT|nr:DNA-directed RNA polymerase subunit omega [Lactococcus termiticola]GBG97043.1 DNA-directed RNA polymerase subunit omega [Lactococcus termiticola]
MMLEPSIDKLLDAVDSKYSLVVLEAKRAHELRDQERETKLYPNDPRVAYVAPEERKERVFQSVKPTLQALEEIAEGRVSIHPAPDAKRETLAQKKELASLNARMEEKLIKEQIEQEEAEEEAKNKAAKASKAAKAEEANEGEGDEAEATASEEE